MFARSVRFTSLARSASKLRAENLGEVVDRSVGKEGEGLKGKSGIVGSLGLPHLPSLVIGDPGIRYYVLVRRSLKIHR